MRKCELLKTSDSDLTCYSRRGSFEKQLVFQQSEIREIRLEYVQQNHTAMGAIIGGMTGAAIGGVVASRSNDPETKVEAPVFSIILGAALGAGVGHGIHRHGPVMYRKQ